jgi:hypothetical protein
VTDNTMSFFNRLLNIAGGKLSDLTSKDESLTEERLKAELDKIQAKPGDNAQAELTLRKSAPKEHGKGSADGGKGTKDDGEGPVKKTL